MATRYVRLRTASSASIWILDSIPRRARRSTTTLAHAEAPVPKPRARVPAGAIVPVDAIAHGPGNHEGGVGRRTTPLPLCSPVGEKPAMERDSGAEATTRLTARAQGRRLAAGDSPFLST